MLAIGAEGEGTGAEDAPADPEVGEHMLMAEAACAEVEGCWVIMGEEGGWVRLGELVASGEHAGMGAEDECDGMMAELGCADGALESVLMGGLCMEAALELAEVDASTAGSAGVCAEAGAEDPGLAL
jgi:hypothetical protein